MTPVPRPSQALKNEPRLLSMRGIGKSFSGNEVLTRADFNLRHGEVHVLAGENGAGKSTLIKILAGVYSDYSGTIHVDEKPVRFLSPQEAFAGGVAVIHQEMSLINSMSVADNIFLGREQTGCARLVARRAQADEARSLMETLGLDIDVNDPVERYPLPVRQMIEIGKALGRHARILVMDEPTSALNGPDVDRLFKLISELKATGRGIIYISHRMEEIYRLADRITVLRDGQCVGTGTKESIPPDELIRLMVGRPLEQQFPSRVCAAGAERLRLEHVSITDPSNAGRKVAEDISMTLRAGEIVGLAGLQGSGNSELLNGVFGTCGPPASGMVRLDGRPCRIRSPRHSIRQGLALLTNDRQGTGLVPGMSIMRNITLPSLQKHSKRGWLRPRSETSAAVSMVRQLQIKSTSIAQPVQALSGGNQQKVVLAKWMECEPMVLLLDDPTRGVDVGAKHEIYELMNHWTTAGLAILFVSSELSELLAMSDRLLVMHRGRVAAEFNRGQFNAGAVLRAAMGKGMP
ncbi:MAG: sugar ABC transporter ATP-binding protein [Spartobacteria bacterium]|nr:sugar ABC transporter ATP-binding protein [Spartobacteria bacterium]